MVVIGLTGGIASGKSLVSSFLRELGAVVIDADLIAREVVAPGQPALAMIVEAFGPGILRPDGSLDRKALGALVFADPDLRKKLEEITHPFIIARIKEELARLAESCPDGVVVLDAPLLFEAGLEGLVDEVWVVYVDAATQLARLMSRDGLTRAEAEQRLAAQIPLAEKARRADRVIDNSGTPEATRAQVNRLWRELQERRGAK